MVRSAWQDTIDQTQRELHSCPDRCFVCGQAVAVGRDGSTVEAFADMGHTRRLAVVCDRAGCVRALTAAHTGTWLRLFQALAQWPDPALYPLGPYWRIRRAQRFAFRTAQRRTTYVD